jgi:hypothetical protein
LTIFLPSTLLQGGEWLLSLVVATQRIADHRLCDALATGPNQLNRVGLELCRKLSPFPLRHVHLQAHYRAKSGVYESGGTSIVALNARHARFAGNIVW